MDVRNGQFRASRIRGDGRDSTPGKGGWFRREGQPPGPSMIVTHLTPEGGSESWGGGGARRFGNNRRGVPRWTPNAQGFPALGSLTPAEEKRCERSVHDSSSKVMARDTTMVPTSPLEMGRRSSGLNGGCGLLGRLGRRSRRSQWASWM